ncbi:MAG: PAS domain S-box protein, partial [Chloroflexi bacterium]|nr:PAS domain S-box protein [Chloroflexota bacterium]
LPAAAAVRGYEGILAGIDYRGVPVWAAARAIPNSPWSLVAKIDAAEITTPMEASARFVLVLIGVFVLIAAGVTALIARNQQLGLYRKQYEAERQGRNLALQLDHLSRHANDIILLMDDQYRIVQANERAVAAYGYPREQLLRMNARDLRAPQARDAFDENVKRVTEDEGLVYETLNIRRDGTIFPVEASTRSIELEGKTYYQAIIRDITERKRAEQALRASEERYRTLAEAAHDHIYVINRDGTVEYVNRFGANLFRARPEDLVHKPLSAVFPSEVAEAYKAALTLVFESEEPLYAEGITEFPSGRLWLSTWLVPLKDAAGHARTSPSASRWKSKRSVAPSNWLCCTTRA